MARDVRRETLLAMARVYRRHARAQMHAAKMCRDASLRNSLRDVASTLFALEHSIVSAAGGNPLCLEELAAVNAGWLASECFTLPDPERN